MIIVHHYILTQLTLLDGWICTKLALDDITKIQVVEHVLNPDL